MRTTLTLDDDVAAMIRKIRKKRDATLKEIVNEALREGLRRLEEPPKSRKRFKIRPLDVGPCLVGSIDDVHGLLSDLEEDPLK